MTAPCRPFEDLLDSAVDAPLAPARQAALDRHLAECADCAQTARAGQRIDAALRSVRDLEDARDATLPPLPEALVGRLLGAIACARTETLLESSLDAPLSLADQTKVDEHLATCPACVRAMQDTVRTVDALRSLAAVEAAQPAPPVPEDLVQRILAARKAAQLADKRSERRSG